MGPSGRSGDRMTLIAGSKPRLLFVHPVLRPPGGAEGVAAASSEANAALRSTATQRGLARMMGTSEIEDGRASPPWLPRECES